MNANHPSFSPMKAVILAGGFGTRIREETAAKPKPMVEIGDKPILWHIMKLYSHYGFQDFVICLGYKSEAVKEYFFHHFVNQSDVTFDYSGRQQEVIHHYKGEPWKVTLVHTGHNTMTGGRIKRIQPYIGNHPFLLTYGDGLSDVNLGELVRYHRSHGKYATVTAVQPVGRFGVIQLGANNEVLSFQEKPKSGGNWINGGFFVMEPEVFHYIQNDEAVLEQEILEALARDGQLMAYQHSGFWQPMDTLRDKQELEKLWNAGTAPWKTWVK